MKRLVKYRVVFEFNQKDYLNKETSWKCDYITADEIEKLADCWDVKYTTYDSLLEDIDKLPCTRLRRGLFGKYIYIHFPYDMEPYQIYKYDTKYFPMRTYLEVKDYNPPISELADNLDTISFLEFLKDNKLTEGLIKNVVTS